MEIKDKFSVLCAWCDSWIKKIHEDHEEVVVSHGLCVDCSEGIHEELHVSQFKEDDFAK